MIKLLLTNREIHNEILKLFKNASKIKCAVAFWGSGATTIFESSRTKDIEIVCNLMTGGTNPEEIIKLQNQIKLPSNIKMDDKLHAKIYWSENGAIIGSVNASSNGLALEAKEITGWKEACILTDDSHIIKNIEKWFNDTLFPSAKEIKKSDFEKAELIWKKRILSRINTNNQSSFIGALSSGVYNKRNIHIVIDNTFLTEKQKKAGETYAQNLKQNEPWLRNKKVSYWLGYKKIPREATIFNFYNDEGKIKFENIYFTMPKTNDLNDFQFCVLVRPDSIEMPKKHVSALRKAVHLYYKDKISEIQKNNGEEISLDDFTINLLQRKDIIEKIKG